MKNLNQNFAKQLLLALIFVFIFQSCTKDEVQDNLPTPETHEQGEISNTHSLGTFTPEDIQQIFVAANIQVPFVLEYSVEVLSIEYYTVDGDDDITLASGAFMIPQGINNMPLLSMQHGTESKSDRVASVSPNNSTEGVVGLLTASLGYFTVVPDYIGFGISNLRHPYMHMTSIVPSVVDFMRAGKSYSAENQIILNEKVFLIGYSEGGYASLGTQKAIEEQYSNEFNLTAVAPCAGPYDLKGMTDSIFKADSYGNPAYIAYFFSSYNDIYKWNRLDDFFQAPYNTTIQSLYDGSKTWGQIVNQLPASFAELMNPTFVDAYNKGNEANFSAAISESTLLDWSPQTPIHFFHGDADKIVPYQNVLTAIEKLSAKGEVEIQLTTIPGGTHESSGLSAIVGSIEWFESF